MTDKSLVEIVDLLIDWATTQKQFSMMNLEDMIRNGVMIASIEKHGGVLNRVAKHLMLNRTTVVMRIESKGLIDELVRVRAWNVQKTDDTWDFKKPTV